MKRLFIAINLPEKVKDELEENIKEISGLFPEESRRGVASWVEREKLHLTLLFIGGVRDENIPAVCEAARAVAEKHGPFDIQLKRICYGPPRKIPPRLIWLELVKNEHLTVIANELKERMSEAGLLTKFEDRPFSAHITLARIKAWQWRKIEPDEQPDIERDISLNFEAKSIEVMESVLKRSGAEYAILERISL